MGHPAKEGADVAIAVTTASGLVTLVVTGDVHAASVAADGEGLALLGLNGGMGGENEVHDVYDAASSVVNLITAGRKR